MHHSGHEETRYIIMVLCPSKEKETKSATETSRTFATLFADINFRSVNGGSHPHQPQNSLSHHLLAKKEKSYNSLVLTS